MTVDPRDAQVLSDGDGLGPRATANWAAFNAGGHVGRARRLATDPQARQRRERGFGAAIRDAATPSRAFYAAAEELWLWRRGRGL